MANIYWTTPVSSRQSRRINSAAKDCSKTAAGRITTDPIMVWDYSEKPYYMTEEEYDIKMWW